MTRTYRIGTRGSELALVQARWVAARLAEHGVATEIVIIRTEGDDRPVDTAWGEGAFVGRIVAALLDGRVDLAVHSAKDVPTDEPDRLRDRGLPAARGPARRARLPRPRHDARDAAARCPGRHRQPATGRLPAGRPPRPRAPPAPRQRRHAARQAGPRRQRRAGAGGGRPDPARPRRPHRRRAGVHHRAVRPRAGLARAPGPRRRRRGDRRRGPAGRPGDARRRRGRARAARRHGRRLPVADRGAGDRGRRTS